VLLTESIEVGAKRIIGEVLFPEYASVRHFARWVRQKIKPFPLGCPTDGVKPPEEPEPEWKGLSRADKLRG
jgi:hypothetical protein